MNQFGNFLRQVRLRRKRTADELSGVTVFGTTEAPAAVRAALEGAGFRVVEEGENRVRATAPSGSLVLNTLRWEKGGDRASKIVLGAIAYAEHEGSNDAELIGTLEDCAVIIGMPVEPPMTSGDDRWLATLEVARAVNGVVFDGCAFHRPGS